jgi:predicted Zn finger-like uncharacterized protein
MRLVCPNCEAKYEVPDDAIPDTGRDVQCANCGHAWYHMRSRAGSAAVAAPEAPPAPTPDPAPQPADAAPAEPEAAQAATAEVAVADAPAEASPKAAESPAPKAEAPEVDTPAADASVTEAALPEAEAEPQADPEPEAAPAAVAKTPYAVDDSVLAILREEAEREANARRAEARPLESQTELGIDAAPPVKAAVSEAETRPSARRDLLPDVEEINSTLRPSEQLAEADAAGGGDMAMPPPRRGFRSGFLTVMTLAILGAAVYITAPRLSAAVPSLAGPLDAYVGFVDGFRLQLDGLMRSATVAINGG